MVEVGQTISGKYKLLRLLGDGGMGSVYEAEHMGLGTRVALKVLHADLARRSGIAERFLQEARVSAQIRSSHVVQVMDVDRTPEGVAYLVMELLQGEPLSAVVKRERTLTVSTACEYTTQILQALESAHALGVIHRDLKPDNVFVTFQGGKPVLKLIDFGIAKLKTAQAGQTKNLTVAGMLMGTPEYMAPEQAYSADKVDVRADLYAVGVMLYEMLSGQPPAIADDPRVLILKVERGEVTPLVQVVPNIQPEIAGFVHRAMAPRPELRFANATEMRIVLEEILSGKRQGTAKIVANPLAVKTPAALADTADAAPQAIGTGTVMGAPVADALSAFPSPPAMGGGTVGAPPLNAGAFSMTPGGAPYGPPMGDGGFGGPQLAPPPFEATQTPPRPSKGGGSGVIIVLAIIAALLGAGAVVAYVVSTQPSSSNVPPPPFDPGTPTTATTTSTANAPPVSVTPVTPLTPATTITPTPPPTHTPVAKKDAGAPSQADAGPPASADAGAGQTTIVTPFGTFQFPGPRPPFYPPDQPWPPPTIQPLPGPPR